MLTKKVVQEEIGQLETLHVLTKVYGEVAAMRMKKTRDGVLFSRAYHEEIRDVFQKVFAAYMKQIRLRLKKKSKRKDQITFLSHNGKTVVVFLSSQTGLYGEVMLKTFDSFMEEVRSGGVEATIIGKYGAVLFEREMPNHPMTYFDFPDMGIAKENLEKLVSHLVQYEVIHMHYPRFNSLVRQDPVMTDISTSMGTVESQDNKPIKYYFEPSLEGILQFFESEMFASVFEQAIRESQLAKSASRIVAMDKAGENIKDTLKKVRFNRLRVIHREKNRKQLNSFAGRYMGR